MLLATNSNAIFIWTFFNFKLIFIYVCSLGPDWQYFSIVSVSGLDSVIQFIWWFVYVIVSLVIYFLFQWHYCLMGQMIKILMRFTVNYFDRFWKLDWLEKVLLFQVEFYTFVQYGHYWYISCILLVPVDHFCSSSIYHMEISGVFRIIFIR